MDYEDTPIPSLTDITTVFPEALVKHVEEKYDVSARRHTLIIQVGDAKIHVSAPLKQDVRVAVFKALGVLKASDDANSYCDSDCPVCGGEEQRKYCVGSKGLAKQFRVETPEEQHSRESSPDDLRDMGLEVMSHCDGNDKGVRYTYWKIRHEASGAIFQGKGQTDRDALNAIRETLHKGSLAGVYNWPLKDRT